MSDDVTVLVDFRSQSRSVDSNLFFEQNAMQNSRTWDGACLEISQNDRSFRMHHKMMAYESLKKNQLFKVVDSFTVILIIEVAGFTYI